MTTSRMQFSSTRDSNLNVISYTLSKPSQYDGYNKFSLSAKLTDGKGIFPAAVTFLLNSSECAKPIAISHNEDETLANFVLNSKVTSDTEFSEKILREAKNLIEVNQ